MTNVSPVEHQYQFMKASTESDDLAAQVLYLTENLRRLQNEFDQMEDIYDTAEKEELVASVGGAHQAIGLRSTQDITGPSIGAIATFDTLLSNSTNSGSFSVSSGPSAANPSTRIQFGVLASTATVMFAGHISLESPNGNGHIHGTIKTSTGEVAECWAAARTTVTTPGFTTFSSITKAMFSGAHVVGSTATWYSVTAFNRYNNTSPFEIEFWAFVVN
jgi:hypothetical protein